MVENKGYRQKDISEGHREYYEARRQSKKKHSLKEVKARLKKAKTCYIHIPMVGRSGMRVKTTKPEMTRILKECSELSEFDSNEHFWLRDNGDLVLAINCLDMNI